MAWWLAAVTNVCFGPTPSREAGTYYVTQQTVTPLQQKANDQSQIPIVQKNQKLHLVEMENISKINRQTTGE